MRGFTCVQRRSRHGLAALLATTTLYGLASPASAQTADTTPVAQPAGDEAPAPADADRESAPGDIIVTANRYEQTLQRTPLAVTALNADALDRNNVVDLEDMSSLAPSLNIAANGSHGAVDISIRGITSRNINAYSGAPAVAVHIDGVYIPRPVAIQQALFDIERVEILRGPQGTLYGRNATAGVINIISARPEQEFGGHADITYGNYETIRANAVVNVPISDRLAARAVFFANYNDGYIDTLGTTRRNGNQARQIGGRLSLLWRPTESISWLVTGEIFKDDGTPNLAEPTPVPGTAFTAPLGFSPYRRPISTGQEPILEVDARSIRTNLDIDFGGGFSATYVGGYAETGVYTRTDSDGQPLVSGEIVYDDDNWNTSHELDLRYVSDALRVVVGAIYTHESGSGTNLSENYLAVGAAPQQLQFPHPNFLQTSYGLFGQATWSITDRIRVTGGLRYSYDKASNEGSGQLQCPRFTPIFSQVPPCARFVPNNEQANSWDNVGWRIGADADLTDQIMAYAAVSTGYKQGQLSRGANPEVLPEEVINYEAGLRTRLFDNQLTLNLTGYYMQYTNLQVAQVVTIGVGVTQNITTNAAEASILGLELESVWQPTRNDRFTAQVSLMRARYDDFKDTVDSIVSNTRLLDLSGNALIRSPDFTARITYSHDFQLANGGIIRPYGTFFYSSSYYLREFNSPWDRQPAYTQTDLRLSYIAPEERFTVEVYVQNLENEAVRVNSYNSPPFLQSFYAPPRLYGARLSYRF